MKADRRKLLTALGTMGALGAVVPWAWSAGKVKPSDNSVLIVVDVQNCFIEGGTLPVAKGSEVVPVINRISKAFENIVITQDWHTPKATPRLHRHTQAKNRLKPPSSAMAHKCCGQTIACKAPKTQSYTKTWPCPRHS